MACLETANRWLNFIIFLYHSIVFFCWSVDTIPQLVSSAHAVYVSGPDRSCPIECLALRIIIIGGVIVSAAVIAYWVHVELSLGKSELNPYVRTYGKNEADKVDD